MMKKKIIFLLAVFGLVNSGLQASSFDATLSVNEVAAATLTVAPIILEFNTHTGGSKSITVTSNTSWTVSKSVSWLTLSRTSGSNGGTITVTVAANTGIGRSTNITFTGGGITKSVYVMQAGIPTLTVSKTSISFPASLSGTRPFDYIDVTATQDAGSTATLNVSTTSLGFTLSEGGSKSITITSGSTWTVSRPAVAWLTVSPASGSGNGTLTVTATPNNGTITRTGTFTVTCGCGTVQTVTITQSVDGTVSNMEVAAQGNVSCFYGILKVNTPSAERVDVYSIGGTLLYSVQKMAGEASYDIRQLPKGMLIVRGSSGWVKKIIK
jgi:hypothetical protein